MEDAKEREKEMGEREIRAERKSGKERMKVSKKKERKISMKKERKE